MHSTWPHQATFRARLGLLGGQLAPHAVQGSFQRGLLLQRQRQRALQLGLLVRQLRAVLDEALALRLPCMLPRVMPARHAAMGSSAISQRLGTCHVSTCMWPVILAYQLAASPSCQV